MSNFVKRTACPACHGSQLNVLYSVPYSDRQLSSYLARYYGDQGNPRLDRLDGENYRLMECPECGLVFQDRVPTSDFSMELYEVWIDPKSVTAAIEGGDIKQRQFRDLRLIKRMLGRIGKPSRQVKVVDIGMGWGEWLFAARSYGCIGYGVELSPARIEFGKANGIRILNWSDLASEKFDIVHCEQVLEHLDDPRGALETMKGCLAPGGFLTIGVPNVGPLMDRLRTGKGVDWSGARSSRDCPNPTEAVTPLEHLNSFSGTSLRKAAKLAGLDEVRFSLTDVASTSAMDRDSVKDLIKDTMIRFGVVDRFASAIFTHARA